MAVRGIVVAMAVCAYAAPVNARPVLTPMYQAYSDTMQQLVLEHQQGALSTANFIATSSETLRHFAGKLETADLENGAAAPNSQKKGLPYVGHAAEEVLRSHYDKHVKYWSTVSSASATKAMLAGLKIDPPQNGKVLDLGCGDGRLSLYLAKHHGMSAVGIDMSAPRVAKGVKDAVTHGVSDKVTLRVGDIYAEVSDPTKKWDLIAAFEVLEHLEEPDQLIRDGIAQLTPTGWFIGSVPKHFPYDAHLQTYYNIENVKMKLNPDFMFEQGNSVFMKWAAGSVGPPKLGRRQPTPAPGEATWPRKMNHAKNAYAAKQESLGLK